MPRNGRGRAGVAVALAISCFLGACSSGVPSQDEANGDDERRDADDARTPTAPTTTTLPAPAFERFTLDNGLDVVLYPVDGATNTALLVAYEVGERHDPPGQSGLAHVTEQVYSTAATGLVPPRAAFEYASRYPARWWSETGDDHSVMARVFPGADLDREITEAAARMLSLTVTQDDLDRERERVLLDIDNILAADPALAARTRAEELIQPSPNGGNQMGIPAQVAQLELLSVSDRLRAIYKPANATVVIVGAFDPAAARSTVDQFFGLVPPGQAAGQGAPWGLAGFGEVASVSVVPRAGATPGVSTASVGYLAPAPDDPTYPAFLTHIARMQSAGDVDLMAVTYSPLQTTGVVTVSTPLAPGETDDAVVERIRAWIAAQLAQPIDDVDRRQVSETVAGVFGGGGYPERQLLDDPYSVALSLARTERLRVDPEGLAVAVAELTDADLEASASATFGPDRSAAAVVLVEPP